MTSVEKFVSDVSVGPPNQNILPGSGFCRSFSEIYIYKAKILVGLSFLVSKS